MKKLDHAVQIVMPQSIRPKRLSPKHDVLRKLYLLSGNTCAFPKCTVSIVNRDGKYIGNLCHIEAALPDAPRFNPNSTNEERRAFHNLMLMCYEHHVETNDEAKYSVQKLKGIKSAHESKFTKIIESIADEIRDHTLVTQYVAPTNIAALKKVVNFDEEDKDSIELGVKRLGEILRTLPSETRQVFQFFVECVTGEEKPFVSSFKFSGYVSLSRSKLLTHMHVLENEGLLYNDYDDNVATNAWVLNGPKTSAGWPVVAILKEFAQQSNIDMKVLLVELNFSSLQS